MNSKIVKSMAAFAACALMLCTVAFAVVNIPTAPVNGFVKDLANVISPSQEKAINDMVQQLVNDNGAEVMLLTVDFTDGMDIMDYTGEVFDEWRPGDRNKDNGLLLVMSIGDDDYYYMVGSGLEDNISYTTLDDILYEELEPYFAQGDYGNGAVKVAGALVEEIGSIYGYDENQVVDNGGTAVSSLRRYAVMRIVSFLIMTILILVVVNSVIRALHGRGRYYNRYGGYSSGYRGSYRSSGSSYRPSRSSYRSSYRSSSSSSSSSSGSRRSSSSRSSYHRSGGGSTRGGGGGRRSGGGRRR